MDFSTPPPAVVPSVRAGHDLDPAVLCNPNKAGVDRACRRLDRRRLIDPGNCCPRSDLPGPRPH